MTAALYRLLLAFLHRVHEGPTSEAQWEHLWTHGVDIACLSEYEESHREAFWLLEENTLLPMPRPVQ